MKKPRWPLVAAAVLVPSLALGFATAPSAREKLVSLLRSIETPASPADLARAAEDDSAGSEATSELLRDLAGDDQINQHARWAAITALEHYPGSSTEERLLALIERGRTVRAGAPTLHARAAALSLARIDGGKAVPFVAPLLDHVVPDVRADAARALGLTGSPDALPALRARLHVEESEMVKVEIVDAIRAVTP
jgi:hypothetical protein